MLIPWYHLNWIDKSHLFKYRKNSDTLSFLTAEPGLPTTMFNIPLASPFCIFYRTGLTPYPSSLNVSNIHTLLAHRFHLLKLLVIINYILIVVKYNLFIILYELFSLILVKTISFLFILNIYRLQYLLQQYISLSFLYL